MTMGVLEGQPKTEVTLSCANCRNVWKEHIGESESIRYQRIIHRRRGDAEFDPQFQRMALEHALVASDNRKSRILSCEACGADRDIYIVARRDLT